MHRNVFSTLLIVVLVFSFASRADAESPAKKLLLLGQSPDGHPPETHEYMAGVNLLRKILADQPGLNVTVVKADGAWTEGPQLLEEADGVVLFLSEGAKWLHAAPRRLDAFSRLASRGGGLVTIHWAMGTKEADYIDGYLNLLGGCHGGPDRRYKVVSGATVEIVDAKHPIVAGLKPFVVRDEFYYKLKFVKAEPGVTPIVQTELDGNLETVGWTWERPDGGRSFGFSGGHFHDNWRHEEYRRLAAQATLWTLKLPVPEDGLNVDVGEDDLKLK